MSKIALFDLDNTLLTCDSDHSWGEFLASQGFIDAEEYRKKNDQYYHDYLAGRLDILEFLRFALKPLSEIEPNTLFQLREEFLTGIIPSKVATNIHERLRNHQTAGDTCAIITATNDFITQPIADFFQVPLIATQAEQVGQRYTGNITGLPCFGPRKIDRLKAWLNDNQHKGNGLITFYSDSINDLPLLKHADVPIVVNPDQKLLDVAKNNQWPCLFHPTD